MAHPIELRQEVVGLLEAGHTIQELANRFSLPKQTISRWRSEENLPSRKYIAWKNLEAKKKNIPPQKIVAIPIGKKKNYVYFVRETWKGLIKIGVASNTNKRLYTLSNCCPQSLVLMGYIFSENAYQLEQHLHHIFDEKRYAGEWFSLDDADIDLIIKNYNATTI